MAGWMQDHLKAQPSCLGGLSGPNVVSQVIKGQWHPTGPGQCTCSAQSPQLPSLFLYNVASTANMGDVSEVSEDVSRFRVLLLAGGGW